VPRNLARSFAAGLLAGRWQSLLLLISLSHLLPYESVITCTSNRRGYSCSGSDRIRRPLGSAPRRCSKPNCRASPQSGSQPKHHSGAGRGAAHYQQLRCPAQPLTGGRYTHWGHTRAFAQFSGRCARATHCFAAAPVAVERRSAHPQPRYYLQQRAANLSAARSGAVVPGSTITKVAPT
jgi:hypothetical protein